MENIIKAEFKVTVLKCESFMIFNKYEYLICYTVTMFLFSPIRNISNN